jgi:peptide/nickel transport system ATP-binding protein
VKEQRVKKIIRFDPELKKMGKEDLLEVRNLTTTFYRKNESTIAVNDLSFILKTGETLGMVGESGSGKSVTALSILRLIPLSEGKIVNGKILLHEQKRAPRDLVKLNEKEMQDIRGKRISMIFQEPMTSLNPVFTCGMQVSETLTRHFKVSRKDAKQRTLELFEETRLPRAGAIFSSYPHELSGGQKQRVMIAMAIACRPEILIADEPTTALDVTVQKTILGLLKEVQKKYGMSILFITHDLAVVADIADRVMVMYKGQSVEENDTRSIFASPRHPYTRGLISCRPPVNLRLKRLPTVEDFLPGAEKNDEIDKSRVSFLFSSGNIESAEERLMRHLVIYSRHPVLEVKNIRTWFPSSYSWLGKQKNYIRAVDDVTFEVYPGEVLGIVGESGSGKTTLGRTILNLVKAASGRVVFEKKELNKLKPQQMKEIRKDLQIIFQDPYSSLNPRKTIGSAIAEPMKIHGLHENERKRKEKTIELLRHVGLEEKHYDRYPHEFSGGQRQRICIARALSLNPKLIICDESVSALDVSVQAQVLNLLNELKREFHFTYVFISHDLSVVRFMSDRLIVMKEGKIEEMGSTDKIYLNPRSDYTRQLLDSIPKIKTWSVSS